MEKLFRKGKRLFALFMVALLVLGLVPMNSLNVSAEETVAAPSLTINMDATKGEITVVQDSDSGELVDTDGDDANNIFAYELTAGETYTVTIVAKDNSGSGGVQEVIYKVYDGDSNAVELTADAFAIAEVADDSVFDYDVKFESDTSLITVNYPQADIDIDSVIFNVGEEVSKITGTINTLVYRVLPTEEVQLTVMPVKDTATVASDTGTVNFGNPATVELGACATATTVNLSVEKVTVNASSLIQNTTLKVYEDGLLDENEVTETNGSYTITKGSTCYVVVDSILDLERLVASDGDEGTYEIADDNGTYKITLGQVDSNKTVVISEKEFPKVVITVPSAKVSSVTLADGNGNVAGGTTVNGETTTYEFEGREGTAYTATITPVDNDAIVTANAGYQVVGTEGDRTIAISALTTSGATVTLDVENQYTLSFAEGYGNIYRLDTANGNSVRVENGKLLVGENDTNVKLKIVPAIGKYISGLQFNSGDVAFDATKLNTSNFAYEFDVDVTADATISVEYANIAVSTPVPMEDILAKAFTDSANDEAVEKDGKEVYYINSAVALTLANSSGTLLFEGEDSFVSTKTVNETTTFAGVTVLSGATVFGEGMLKAYTFTTPVQFVMDTTAPNAVMTNGSTKYFGANSTGVELKVTASDTSGISKVVYFTEEKDVSADRTEILENGTELSLVNGIYTASLSESATTDKTYYVYAIDNAENIKKVNHTVYYDSLAPTGGTISIKNITSFIDYTYVKSDIILVEATDIIDPVLDEGSSISGSGIKSIKAILKKVDGTVVETVELNAEHKATFTRRLAEGVRYYISIEATDNVGNVTTIAEAAITNGFKQIIYDYSAPSINVAPQLSSSNAGVYKKDANTLYISQDVFDAGLLFEVLVKDYTQEVRPDNCYASGLESLTVTINGETIAVDNAGTALKNYEALDVHTYDDSFVINLSQGTSTDGKYVITLSAKDQAGNVSAPFTYTVYVDNTKPTIGTITVNGTEATKGEFRSYGFFTKDKFDIQISGVDGTNSDADSKINYYLVEYIEGNTVVRKDTISGAESTFVKQITSNFKGKVKVTAYDKVGNISTVSLTNGLICEKENTHSTNAGVVLTTPETPMRDVNGNQLYAENTSVNVSVTDTYAGIKALEWSVVAPYDTENNASGTMTADALASDWTADATDNGVVTKVSGTIPVTNNSNSIVVKVTVTDNAGNISTNNVTVSIDKTNPAINVSVTGDDADTQYATTFNGDRVATITVRERNFKAEDVNVTITNSDQAVPGVTNWIKTEDTSNPDNNTYTATVAFSADGDYTLDVAYTDLAAREAVAPAQQQITIDKTNPVATVSFDGTAVNGFYYAAARTATIVINEHNFDSGRIELTGTATSDGAAVAIPTIGGWSTSGDTHTATISFAEDADYQLTISGTDQAGNTFEQALDNFVVDKVVPEVTISGIEDQSANAGDVKPVITFSDINYDANGVNISLVGANNGEMELDGSFSQTTNGQVFTFNNFPKEQHYDDIYTLTATKSDMAGNETTETITFSVNRFGSVYTFGDELKGIVGKYVKEPFTIVLTETNIDRLDPDSIKVVLTINGTPKTLVRDVDYTIEETGTEASWKQYVYTINPSVFAGDGSYSVAIYSIDNAGNVNENINEVKEAEIIFGIDATAPIVEAIDFESGFTSETAYLATFSAVDNIILESVAVSINGTVVETTEDNEMYSFTIPEAPERQTVVITARDAAGNETVMEYTDILISSNAWVNFFNNTPLLIGSIAGVAVVGGGAGTAVFLRRRKIIKIKK